MRGVARSAIAVDAIDYERMGYLLERATSRFELACHAWCFLPNHLHLLVTSQLGNLSDAMHWFGTCTAQSFNLRHERVGHLFQGRFESRLVEDDNYFLELARYLPLNPVRAGLCDSPGEWPWSSYTATAGLRKTPPWFLDAKPLLGMLGSAAAYIAWVGGGGECDSLDEFGRPISPPRPSLAAILPTDCASGVSGAHFGHGYSKAEIARHLGVSRSQISRRLAADVTARSAR